jgi:hypothetical protein
VVLPLAAAGILLAGVLVLGQWARDRLRGNDRYAVAMTDIDCAAPPGLDRQAFLEEVQYLANLPDKLDLLDDELPRKLAEALELHPWVARVERVEKVSPSGLRAEITFRIPALAIELGEGRRAVDAEGTLLPIAAYSSRLPLLEGPARSDKPGAIVIDRRVAAAAATVGYLRPHWKQLALEGCTVSVEDGQVSFKTKNLRVLWGQQPGREDEGEATAGEKRRRLLPPTKLANLETDVRPAAGPKQKQLRE